LEEDDMATTQTQTKGSGSNKRTSNSSGNTDRRDRAGQRNASSGRTKSATQRVSRKLPQTPSWLAAVMSVVGVGVAVGAGLYATRKQWLPKAEEWRNDFSAAFADYETDYENFDQTRHAGRDAMRDEHDQWEDIDEMSDASFPASDPPSFNPGTAG
jgi:hypothetical protein